VSLLVFTGTELLPGDVAEAVLGQDATPETLAAMREELGLNLPAHVRYARLLSHIVQGDLGKSFASGRDISGLIASRLPATLLLGAVTALIALPLAVGLGLYSAAKAGSLPDRIVTNLSHVLFIGPELRSCPTPRSDAPCSDTRDRNFRSNDPDDAQCRAQRHGLILRRDGVTQGRTSVANLVTSRSPKRYRTDRQRH
jgi:hypothetical protein